MNGTKDFFVGAIALVAAGCGLVAAGPASARDATEANETSGDLKPRNIYEMIWGRTDAATTAAAASTDRRQAGAKAGRGPAVAAAAPGDLKARIAAHASAAGVPVELAEAVVAHESKFNPRARGSQGEVGLMQIKPATARALGYRGSVAALYDVETNLTWGMAYLAAAYRLADGDTCGTVLRYNAGHRATRMNRQAANYCSEVRSYVASL